MPLQRFARLPLRRGAIREISVTTSISGIGDDQEFYVVEHSGYGGGSSCARAH